LGSVPPSSTAPSSSLLSSFPPSTSGSQSMRGGEGDLGAGSGGGGGGGEGGGGALPVLTAAYEEGSCSYPTYQFSTGPRCVL
jgi:hypothetical protein